MIYRYRCLSERKEFYIKHKFDKPLKICPHCNGKVEKLIPESVSIAFKGKGFYSTDLTSK